MIATAKRRAPRAPERAPERAPDESQPTPASMLEAVTSAVASLADLPALSQLFGAVDQQRKAALEQAGRALRDARKARGLTMTQIEALAAANGDALTQATISRIEGGAFTVAKGDIYLRALAAFDATQSATQSATQAAR